MEDSKDLRILCGTCPDQQCQNKLYFPAWEETIECQKCGQRHEQKAIQNVGRVQNPEGAVLNILRNMLGNKKPKKEADTVKVNGLSHYECKLLSPYLTHYGMEKQTGKPKLLKDLGQNEMFDCGILGDRSFHIDQSHLRILGYGQDDLARKYLEDTLDWIKTVNNGEDTLIPLHADGDGHCLVHAISRALIGRELFWHPLRENLREHFMKYLDKHKALFSDFMDSDEWKDIIDECDPYFVPPNGEALGLRNIHIFGLANVLRRPIILFDSKSGLQSFGDYSGVFLPGLLTPEECSNKQQVLNQPLGLAWSSQGRNHYIPLVPVKGRSLPKLKRNMLPRVWGLPSESLEIYINFENDLCTLAGNKCLQDSYIQKLANAMEQVFQNEHQITSSLVADVHYYLHNAKDSYLVRPETVIETTVSAVSKKQLYRCITCDALSKLEINGTWLEPGGQLFESAVTVFGKLDPSKRYKFPEHKVECLYDDVRNKLYLDPECSRCSYCKSKQMRIVNPDGTNQYQNGDRTTNPSETNRCGCGFKHYWDGKEYDNRPEIIPISLEWEGKIIPEKVYWWQYEANPSLNSNVFEVADSIVQRHYPGVFGSERLKQKVVDQILAETSKRGDSAMTSSGDTENATAFQDDRASKIILTGQHHKTMHKEELGKSEAEKKVKKRIVTNAPDRQKRHSGDSHSMAKNRQSSIDMPVPSTSQTEIPKSVSMPTMQQTQSLPTTPRRLPTQKQVCLQCGRKQVMWTLEVGITYTALQQKIDYEFNIPPDMQKIKHGFPPKPLIPPANKNDVLPLQHRDKISVEYVDNKHKPSRSSPSPTSFTSGSSQSDIASYLMETLLRADSKEAWNYCQTQPSLFERGGYFYRMIDKELGLTDGKHFTLSSFPNKIFCFNATDDRIEICLEPDGHFPIEKDIEVKVQKGVMTASRSIVTTGHRVRPLTAGGSGVVHRGSESSQNAFSGQGHSLVTDERVPSPTPDMDDEMLNSSLDDNEKDSSSDKYKKIGPGYSIIDQRETNRSNANSDLLKTLARNIIEHTEIRPGSSEYSPMKVSEFHSNQENAATSTVFSQMAALIPSVIPDEEVEEESKNSTEKEPPENMDCS